MRYSAISLSKILVNRANDRHGELADESLAMNWLLTNRSIHMRKLAKDICETGEVYEPPLVSDRNGHFVVFDGNRRMTALKLIAAPDRAPNQEWREYFGRLKDNFHGDIPNEIECQIEEDKDRLDEILFRRHTGQQGGIGQSQWDATAKSNFVNRTGKKTKINVAEEIEVFLKKDGFELAEKIPRSNLNRLLSAEHFRNRVGVTVQNNKLKFTHRKDSVLNALERIAEDLISKNVTLDDLWNNETKTRYLNKLDKNHILPRSEDLLEIASEPELEEESDDTATRRRRKRTTLIRNFDFKLIENHENRRLIDIFHELQTKLKFGQHDNAISVMFRVLLELSIDLYIERENVAAAHPNDKLAKKFSKVATHMEANAIIDKKYAQQIGRFVNSEPLVSTNTLHGYVHSKEAFPVESHLKGMWDTLEKFIVSCIKKST